MSGAVVGVMAAQQIAAAGGAVAFSAGESLATNYSTLSGTTGSFSPGGSNRAIFGAVSGREPSAPPPSLSDCKYGGSGGTSLTFVTGSDQNFSSGAGIVGTYRIAPGPSGSTTIYGILGGSSLGTCLGGVAYEGVDQTTPGDADAYNTGTAAASTTVASVTVTGIQAGDICIARVACSFGNNDGTAFTAVAGTTIRSQPSGGESTTWNNQCWLEKESAGTSCTLEVNVNETTSGDLTWAAHGMRVVAA